MASLTDKDPDISVVVPPVRVDRGFAAACDTSPKAAATSLAGPTAGEGMTCGSGQICQVEVAQDAGISAFCAYPPAGCTVPFTSEEPEFDEHLVKPVERRRLTRSLSYARRSAVAEDRRLEKP